MFTKSTVGHTNNNNTFMILTKLYEQLIINAIELP